MSNFIVEGSPLREKRKNKHQDELDPESLRLIARYRGAPHFWVYENQSLTSAKAQPRREKPEEQVKCLLMRLAQKEFEAKFFSSLDEIRLRASKLGQRS